jgi:hypothetical protein
MILHQEGLHTGFLITSSQKATRGTKKARDFRFYACYNRTYLPPIINEKEHAYKTQEKAPTSKN